MNERPPIDDFPVVGVIGGGQLARMMQQAAIALGVQLRVLSVSAHDSAAQVIGDVRLGAYDDLDAVLAFAKGCDVVTFDHEHVPTAILEALIANGTAVRPSPQALIHAQDKARMREALTAAGLPGPQWQVLAAGLSPTSVSTEVAKFGEAVRWPVVLKTSVGGYDGRGVWVLDNHSEALEVVESHPLPPGGRWLLEEFVDFRRELAAQVARSPHGQAVAYPVVQTTQTDGICTEVIAPAPKLAEASAIEAQRIALRVAEVLGVTGMLTVELFETADGRLLINELAMRPHNSGHWSIDGAVTSQFENHLRAVLDLPLGSPVATAPHSVMVNVIGTDKDHLYSAYRHVMARDPRVKVHMYGKSPRSGRKLGHVTIVGADLPDLVKRAHHSADYLAGVIDE